MWYTAKAVADRFGVTVATVWEWIKQGKLKAVKINSRNVRISEQAIADFIEDRKFN